jgi:hypothetical protein
MRGGEIIGNMDIRFEFSRGREVMYLSHLDLRRVFDRAFRRSGIPICYSAGFNPHAEMVFGLPLAVGVTSACECLDISTEGDIELRDALSRLNAQLPAGLAVSAVCQRSSKANIMAQITHASYEAGVALTGGESAGGGHADGGNVGGGSDGGSDGGGNADSAPIADGAADCVGAALSEAVNAFHAAGEARVVKATKRSTSEIDIKPHVLKLDACGSVLRMTASAGSVDNIKPDMAIDALNGIRRALHPGAPLFSRVALHRTALYVTHCGELRHPLSDS